MLNVTEYGQQDLVSFTTPAFWRHHSLYLRGDSVLLKDAIGHDAVPSISYDTVQHLRGEIVARSNAAPALCRREVIVHRKNPRDFS